jgi:DNA polymerase III subunit alpha
VSNFIHLHCHDEFSLLDGVGTSEQYCKRISELKQTALAITNHGNIDGVYKFRDACKNNNIKAIYGFEGYIVKDRNIKEKGDVRKHILILAKNKTGWINICKMLTIANLEGFYYRPRIDIETLKNHSEGLIISSACSSSFIDSDYGIDLIEFFIDNKIDFFGEIMPLNFESQIKMNLKVLKLQKKYKFKIIVTNDCHYVNQKDNILQEVLLAIQSKKKWTDKDRWRFDIDDLFVKSERAMIESFKKQNSLSDDIYLSALKNTKLIEEMCEFKLENNKINLPAVPGFENINENDKFKELCYKGLNDKIIITGKIEYTERLEFELKTIIELGFVRYFLIVWELINWCKNNDIMVGAGRGSSGGSLICYLLNITEVDPIKYGLLFGRFISPARIDLPDIDMDFEDRKRYLIREHLEKLYGKDCVAGVATLSSMKGKGAIRDVSRVFNIPLTEVGKACDCIVVRSGGDARSDFTIEDAFNTFEDGKKFKEKYPNIVDYASRLEGQIKTKGMHAAAICINDTDLRNGEKCVLQYGKDKNVIINYDKMDLENCGLMKLDVLGLNALTVLSECKNIIKEKYNIGIDYNKIPLDDEKVFKEFSEGNNIGCFQVGSLGLRRFCRQLGIDNFMMLVHASSLYRPGTLRSGITTKFVQRKRGEEEIPNVHPLIWDITKNTYGVILYQEQVMQFMYDLGGLGWKTADTVRKVISKSQGVETFQKFKKDFADGCEKKGTLKREEAEILWSELASFGSYGFNLSHAVEYSLISYWDQWLKVHYPLEFICVSLTYGSDEKKDDLIEEAFRLNIKISPPKIGISKAYDFIIRDNTLYLPFIEIKGFGEKTAKYAEEFKKNKNEGFFSAEKEKNKLTQRFINILEEIKAFENIELDDEEAERIQNYFQYSLIRDKSRKIRPIFELISKHITFSKIVNIDFNTSDREERFYYGKMTEIKFGYRGKIDTLEKQLGYSEVKDNLGCVYGNFIDGTDFCMLVFDAKIYKNKKDLIEHCSDKILISKANRPNRTNSIMCYDAWFEEEILKCELNGLNIKLANKKRFKNNEILNCSDCDLIQECNKPVLNSTGLYNIMIIGEAPGRDEDKNGIGFCGDSGKLVWKELERYNLKREFFNVSNVVKCYPSKSKTPNKIHIKHCSKWLNEEIEKIQPTMILAFGNTNLKFFNDEDSGIMNKNANTEWNFKYKTWISWCIHPASVLYSPENRKLFEEGIKNFALKVNEFFI